MIVASNNNQSGNGNGNGYGYGYQRCVCRSNDQLSLISAYPDVAQCCSIGGPKVTFVRMLILMPLLVSH